MNLSTYLSNGMVSAFIQGTSIAMRADYAEANPLMGRLVGGLDFSISQIIQLIESSIKDVSGVVTRASATNVPISDESISLVATDPPYYDSIPYSHLSDIFYLWMKACLSDIYPELFQSSLIEKTEEIVEDRFHSRSPTQKGADFFEREMGRAMGEALRVTREQDLMVVVFAHKSTTGWEAMLNSLLNAGWCVSGSWPIDTERSARLNALQNASLSSSIHITCRPRNSKEIGDWRDVLRELPMRIHEWMPRLAKEGVVGADAIFAC